MGRLGWRAALALAAVAVPVAAAGARGTPVAEVDVVAKTNLRITPEHTEMYVSTLGRYARMCLGGLTPRSVKAAAQPQDGAAHYRLTVLHTGSVVPASKPKIGRAVERSDPSGRYLLTQQKGKFQFELTRWSGAAYESVDKWTSEFSTIHHTPIPTEVPPSGIPKWQRTAIMRAYPEAVRDGILDHLLPIRVVRTFGPPGGTQNVVLTVTNQSLWPLKGAAIVVSWTDRRARQPHRYRADVRYAGLLMPGETVTLKGAGQVSHVTYYYEFALPLQITAMPTFDPNRGPVWVRRHVASMKDPATRAMGARLIERSLGRFVPTETKAAVEALLDLLAHDAPQTDADVLPEARMLLERIGQPAVPLLADALANENPGIRLGAACVLQKVKVTDRGVLARLQTALKDACEPVRAAAAKALEANGAKAEVQPDAKPPQDAK